MENYQNNKDSTDDIEVTGKMQLQLKSDNFYNYGATGNDGFHYTLAMHKSARLLLFSKVAENATESQMGGHCIWVDASGMARYQILDEDQATKLVPIEFITAKYSQARWFFARLGSIQNEIDSRKSLTDKDEINSCLIRLVKSLIHDITKSEHIAETINNEMELIIHNVTNNEMCTPESVKQSDLMKKNNEWLSLKFNNNGYCLDETVQEENDNTIYYFAVHKTLNHIIFARDSSPKFKTTVAHHLYINQDNGLGRYKVQTDNDIPSKQFFVPVDYVADRYNRFRGLMDKFKKLHDTTDIYANRQSGANYRMTLST